MRPWGSTPLTLPRGVGREFMQQVLEELGPAKICKGGSLAVSSQQPSSISFKICIEDTLKTYIGPAVRKYLLSFYYVPGTVFSI